MEGGKEGELTFSNVTYSTEMQIFQSFVSRMIKDNARKTQTLNFETRSEHSQDT